MGRRHPSPLSCLRPANLGCKCNLRHRRWQAGVSQLFQNARTADRAGKLRCTQRLDRTGAGARHLRAGLVPGRHLGHRLHGFRQPRRDRLLRPRPDLRGPPGTRRLLVDLLVRQPHLRHGDRARARRPGVVPERTPVGQRDSRRRRCRPGCGLQPAAAVPRDLAGRAGRGPRLYRPAGARRGSGCGDHHRGVAVAGSGG